MHVTHATWPAATLQSHRGWTLRGGAGGGQRVSATTREDADAAFEDVVQQPLFMVRPGESDLDATLHNAGYVKRDPTNIYLCPIDRLTDMPIPRVTAFAIWEPLAIMEEIWAKGGVDVARLAVMNRAANKTGILARWNEKPAGAGFAALHQQICMVHAVEVLPHQRRQGVAQWIMRKAAFWAQEHGADWMSVLCTAANQPGNRLYTSLGMTCVGQYHYRYKGPDT